VAESLLRIATPQDEPLVLAGPPGQLTGQIELDNPGDVVVVLRDAGLKDPSGVLSTTFERQTFSPLVVRAHQKRRAPLTVTLDQTTPPGEYRAELELAGGTRPVVLHVSEVIDLTVRPQSIVVMNQPGPQRKRIVVTNEGNVSFVIGDLGDVDLEDDMISERAARLALEPWTTTKGEKIEEPVLALLKIASEDAYRDAGLAVHTLGAGLTVAPGDVAVIDLEVTLQVDLPSNSRYRGRTPLLTRTLEFIVVSSGGPLEKHPAREKKATKGTRRPT
jgi:hypothetical protein